MELKEKTLGYTRYINTLLRVLSAIVIAIVVIVVILSYFISRPAFRRTGTPIEAAHHNVGNDMVDSDVPIYLNGEWEYFPDEYVTDNDDPSALSNPQSITLPLTDYAEAKRAGSYRMYLSLDRLPDGGVALYIPAPQNEINVFLNGVELSSNEHNDNWLNYSRYDSVFFVKDIDNNIEFQEIVISSDGEAGSLGIYRRDIIISSLRNVMTLKLVSLGNDILIVGMLLIMLISSFTFMLFRPSHKMITAMTLFDSMLMVRILFGLIDFFVLINNIVGRTIVTEQFCYSIQILSLFLAGLFGVSLARNIYDPEGRTPKIFSLPPTIAFLIGAAIFTWNIELFIKIGIPILVIIVSYTFIGVAWQTIYCLKKHFTPYYIFQALKTGVIGVIIIMDIASWNKMPDFRLLSLFYCMFFTIHICFRVYDNNNSYKQVEAFNHDLAITIEKRTRELEEANRLLTELSIRDPLTKAYNRLYFEELSKDYISRSEKSGDELYLVMFDLDFFKKVNDTYGHDEGDRQLIAAVDHCNKLLPSGVDLSRIGGEEFTILFIGQSSDAVLELTTALRRRFEKEKEIDLRRTTISVGVTKYEAGLGGTAFFKHADNCLYQAKNTGRNKVCYDFDGTTMDYSDNAIK